jgi:dUTP pyrophosphatase
MNSPGIKVINQSKNELPAFETSGSAGLDIRAHLIEDMHLAPMQRVLVPTGIFLEIPEGMECQVRPRSGLSIKKGLTVINAPGTIDSDYRGEVMVPLINLSSDHQIISNGERIAQLVFARYETIHWIPSKALSPSSRGEKGFGSTGEQ